MRAYSDSPPWLTRQQAVERFRHTAFFIGANTRQAVQEGRADFMPVFLSEIPELIRSHRVRVDVALLQVSPPDAHGYVSLGVSVDVVRSAVEAASLLIAEVNPRMPRTHGDSFVHVSRLHRLVPVDQPLLERPHEEQDAVSREIGGHIARLIPDGATLQLGIGKIPDAVLAQLTHHKDLGLHTEMMSDGVMLQELLYGLSDDSTYRRFMCFKRRHPHEEVQELVNLDYEQNMALVACVPGTDEVVGVVRYDVVPSTGLADMAFVVRDDWQGRGMGTALMKRIREAAQARGLPGFQADVLVVNKPMLDVFHESGLTVQARLEGDSYHLELRFPESAG